MENNWKSNPFSISPGIWKDGAFVDRDRLIGSYIGDIKGPSAGTEAIVCLLLGPKRIGKSSLLQRIWAEVNGKAESDLPRGQALAAYYDFSQECAQHWWEVEDPRDMNARVDRAIAEINREFRDVGNGTGIGGCSESPSFSTPAIFAQLAKEEKRRLVVILDEIEAILPPRGGEKLNSVYLDRILREFRISADPPPVLILSWGKSWGYRLDSSVAQQVTRASRIDRLGHFDDPAIDEAVEMAEPHIHFPKKARELLKTVTAGHPYYLMALCRQIFECRKAEQREGQVERDEILRAIPDAYASIEGGIEYAWRQLSEKQSHVGRALAMATQSQSLPALDDPAVSELAEADVDTEAFRSTAALADIEEQLGRANLEVSREDIHSCLEALDENLVVEPKDQRYRLHAPFLGYWLVKRTYENLSRLFEAAEARWQRALFLGEQGNAAGAIAAAREAVEMNPTNATWRGKLASLLRTVGELDAAIEHATKAASLDPATYGDPLCDLLLERIEETVESEADPGEWVSVFEKFNVLSSEKALLRRNKVCTLQARVILDRWQSAVEDGNLDRAVLEFSRLEWEIRTEWRPLAAECYVHLALCAAEDETWLRRCMTLVRDAFLVIVRETFDTYPGSIVLPEPQLLAEAERARAGTADMLRLVPADTEIASKLRERLAQEDAKIEQLRSSRIGAVPPWWAVTIDVLDRGWRIGIDREEPILTADEIRRLFVSVPPSAGGRLATCFRGHFATRCSLAIGTLPREAQDLLQVLLDFALPDGPEERQHTLDAACQTFADFALRLPDSPRPLILAFYAVGAGIYRRLVAEYTKQKGESPIADLLDAIEWIVAAVKPAPSDWGIVLDGLDHLDEWTALLTDESFVADAVSIDPQAVDSTCRGSAGVRAESPGEGTATCRR